MENTIQTEDIIFQTRDIRLAAFLKCHNIKLIGIKPLDRFHSIFVFEKCPQIDSLVDDYISGSPLADARELINSYRHLLLDSRTKQLALANVPTGQV